MKLSKDMDSLIHQMNSLEIQKKTQSQENKKEETTLFSENVDNYFGLRKVSSRFMEKVRETKRNNIIGKKRFKEDDFGLNKNPNSGFLRHKKLVLVDLNGEMKEIEPNQREATLKDSKSKFNLFLKIF